MSYFETKTIEELTDTLIDYRGKTPEKTMEGVKLITAKVIKDGFIQEGNHEFIAEENYKSWMRRGLPKQWDILITTEAPLGEVAQLRTPEKVALAQRVILLRGKSDLIDQGYYFQTFKSDFVQAELKSRGTGTTVLGIKQSELLKVRIPYYPLPNQQKIANILSTYDDLLENNNRRIRILEEMAQGIYRDWFVNFRFPGHEDVMMVESNLGLVPEGWHINKMSKIAILIKDSINPQKYPSEVFLHYSIPNFDQFHLPVETQGIEIKSNKFVVRNGCILVSKLNPRIPRLWILHSQENIRCICSTEFLPLFPKSNELFEFIFFTCTSSEFKDKFSSLVGGTSTSHQRVKSEDLLDMNICIPTSEIIKDFSKNIAPFLTTIEKIKIINQNLRHTRDLLLPKLISGVIDVSDIDIRITEAEA